MAKSNHIGSIRKNNYLSNYPLLLASLDLYAEKYIEGNMLEKLKMLTDKRTVKWTVMQVR